MPFLLPFLFLPFSQFCLVPVLALTQPPFSLPHHCYLAVNKLLALVRTTPSSLPCSSIANRAAKEKLKALQPKATPKVFKGPRYRCGANGTTGCTVESSKPRSFCRLHSWRGACVGKTLGGPKQGGWWLKCSDGATLLSHPRPRHGYARLCDPCTGNADTALEAAEAARLGNGPGAGACVAGAPARVGAPPPPLPRPRDAGVPVPVLAFAGAGAAAAAGAGAAGGGIVARAAAAPGPWDIMLLARRQKERDPDAACPVCFETLPLLTTKTGCEHEFCTACLQKWIDEGDPTCPLCRGGVSAAV